VSLSLWAIVSLSSNECVSEPDSNISFVMFWSVRLLVVAILLNALNPTQHTWHPTPSDRSIVCIAWPVTYYCSDMEQTQVLSWRQLWAWIYISKESQRNCCRRMKNICLWSHIALNIEINICMHFFPFPLIAYEFIRHSTQISQHYHETQTSLWGWNLNSVRKHTTICAVTSIFCSTGSPLTTGAIWKE
jgi:hypothetical protein